MQFAHILVVVVALLALATAQQTPVNCNEVEFDAFSVSSAGVAIATLAQDITSDNNIGASFAGATVSFTLSKTITNGLIEIQIILSPLQGTVTQILSNGSQATVPYQINPDNITLSLNGGPPQTQKYVQAGNNFTFNNFLGNGSTAVINVLNISVIQIAIATPPNTFWNCSSQYAFLLTNPPNVTVKGDPQFMGLRGQSFQVHGIDGAVYNIISDRDVQMNSRFVFLTGPRPCPTMPSTGRKSTACWTHAGSYLGEVGLKYGADQIFIVSGPASTGFAAVTVNGKQLSVGESTSTLQFNSTHELTLSFGAWTIEMENSDMFLNLRSVRVADRAWSSLSSHGLLGQTWANKRYSGKVSAIEGEVDDYMIGENSVFGDSFVFNRYQQS